MDSSLKHHWGKEKNQNEIGNLNITGKGEAKKMKQEIEGMKQEKIVSDFGEFSKFRNGSF